MIKNFQKFLFERFFFSSNTAHLSDFLLVDHPEALLSIVLSSASSVQGGTPNPPKGITLQDRCVGSADKINTNFAPRMDIIITEQDITGGFDRAEQ